MQGAMTGRKDTVAFPWLAAAALVGGLLWVVKGAAILLGYGQPEHAFEVAPLLFALVTLGLARWLPPDRARRFGVILAVTAVLGCLVAAVASIAAGDVLGPDLLTGVVTLTAALVIVGPALRRSSAALGGLALLLGMGTIPAMLVGGAISAIDERLLEVPIVAIGLGWIAVGLALLRQMKTAPRTPSRPSLRGLRGS